MIENKIGIIHAFKTSSIMASQYLFIRLIIIIIATKVRVKKNKQPFLAIRPG